MCASVQEVLGPVAASTAMQRVRPAAVLLSALLLCSAACLTLSARSPGEVGIQGIPVCPAGFPACGMHGCYTPLLSKCDPNNGCISVKILSQLSALVRFGTGAAAHAGACPIGFANTCGQSTFCAMGELCVGGVCQQASSSSQSFTALKVRDSPAAARAACLAARYGSTACAGDTSDLAVVDCNTIGVASIAGIFCFQSQLFNCAVQPGGSATYSCRGIAGVAQAVGEVWNTTLNTAAKVADQVADALAKSEVEHVTSAIGGQAGTLATIGGVPMVVSDPLGSTDGSSGSGSSSAKEVLKAGANAALGSLGQAYRDKGQPILQPLFQGLASMVNNATHNLLNKTGDGIVELGESAKSAIEKRLQPTFDLGRPPIRDAAGGLHVPKLLLTLVSAVQKGAVGLPMAEQEK